MVETDRDQSWRQTGISGGDRQGLRQTVTSAGDRQAGCVSRNGPRPCLRQSAAQTADGSRRSLLCHLDAERMKREDRQVTLQLNM